MACHGFTPSFAFVGEPETNGVVERFNRTLEEQIIHGKTYRDRAELAAAVAAFVLTYNETRSRGYGASSMKVALYSQLRRSAKPP